MQKGGGKTTQNSSLSKASQVTFQGKFLTIFLFDTRTNMVVLNALLKLQLTGVSLITGHQGLKSKEKNLQQTFLELSHGSLSKGRVQ